ncbi:cobalt-precorrin-5B (C(1))-methyltransferase CbiD [Flavobacterium sp. 7A]|uniref:cobalt-precorrin-5B (C(1))-methyltransferase CbiD n=1 Tax=Flavobacterium sp. 7A TaxID=2940571 RepID=UPI002226284C|nr:cobalt-precorrin-5B (C(1))-methyltransferase CbiD [Flavobacterium sp. 7A]MCW2119679.1 cobalt-precorrin-5B (C1)-methyltransferase [Flavobacterium sp. 7A]
MGLEKIPDGPLRDGFTTGTSATAAVKAALISIIKQCHQYHVKVQLPIDKVLEIKIHSNEYTENWAKASVIKDAGDDPDVTNGAEVGCEIQLTTDRSIQFVGGEGVGTVTLPGLELAVGEPAINPVPRKMMTSAVQKLLHDYDLELGVIISVFVVNGKALAKRTLNERVGIMNGLSILGTSGIVKPYSASSYIASIEQGVDVAVANGILELVINSGARSEKFIRGLFPDLIEQSFIHYGNWIGETLEKIKNSAIQKVSIGIMLGKAVKLAGGRTDTHSCVSSWDKEFVVELAQESGYCTNEIAEAILDLNMGGRLIEIFPFEQEEIFYQVMLKHCYQHSHKIMSKTELNLFLVGKNGEIIKYIK